MKPFSTSDNEITKKELAFALTSILIGVDMLYYPRFIASSTENADGWVSIVLAGMIVLVFMWVTAKLGSRFPKQTFFEYSSTLISKPVAFIMTIFIACYYILFTAYLIRFVAILTKNYLFDRTPNEVLSLAFLLVIVYAVSGSRRALFRLHMLFLPIIGVILFITLFSAIPLINMDHLLPLFKTNWKDYASATQSAFIAYYGWGVLLFYTGLVNQPKQAPKYAVMGVSFYMILFLFVYIVVIGVESNIVASNVIYPFVEVAKDIQIPGGFFERLEIVFLTVWVMTIFTSTIVYFDVSVIALSSVFKKGKKQTYVLILAPLIYLIGMVPQDQIQVTMLAVIINYMGYPILLLLPIALLLIAKFRKIKGNG